MSPRSRILAFGSAGLVAVAGGVCAAVVPGLVGQLLAIVLISVGLVAIVSLVFLEVGLSEDRQRATDEQLRQQRTRPSASSSDSSRLRRPRWSRRPG